MAVWYLDPVNGSDAGTGTSWATAWATPVNGATAARINAGDTIRIAKTPDPVNTGVTATWVTGAYQAAAWTSAGTILLNSATNANPMVFTGSSNHGFVAGDYCGIGGATGQTTVNGYWPVTVVSPSTFSIPLAGNGTYNNSSGQLYKVTNQLLKLSAPVTAVISNCDVIWTAGTSCVPSLNSYGSITKEGNGSVKLAVTTPATATKLAYSTIPSTDFSSYQQISFWIQNSVVVTTGQYVLKLCSDVAGVTAVNTVAIPAIPSINQCVAFTLDTGAALGSAIQSVALYTGATTGTTNNISLDHIIACGPSSSPSSLSLTSLVGKNNGTEGWFNVRSINGTILNLDQGSNTTWNNARGYTGTSETVPLWRRETFKTPMLATNQTSTGSLNNAQINKSGSAGNLISFTGGWDTTLNTQIGDTYWDGQNGFGAGFGGNPFGSLSYIAISRMNFSRYWVALGGYDGYPTWTACNISVFNVTNCGKVFNSGFFSSTVALNNVSFNYTENCVYPNGSYGSLTTIGTMFGGNGTGIQLQAGSQSHTINVTNFIACMDKGITLNGSSNGYVINNNVLGVGSSPIPIVNSTQYGVFIDRSSNSLVKNFAISSFIGTDIWDGGTNNGNNNFISNCYYTTWGGGGSDARMILRNPNGSTSASVFCDNMFCQTDLTTVHTAGNRSWKIATSRTSAGYPATLNLGNVVIGGSVINTISAWVRYDTAAMIAGIQVVGGQVEGMTSTQLVTSTGTANTWIQVTMTISSATQSGPVMLQAYGLSSSGTQNMWIADISVT